MALSDHKLFKLGRQRDDLKAQIAALQQQLLDTDTDILVELETRGTSAVVEVETGYKVGRAQAEVVVYDEPRLVRWAARKGLCVTKEVFDRSALSALVQQKKITTTTLAKYSSLKYNKPYVTTSGGSA